MSGDKTALEKNLQTDAGREEEPYQPQAEVVLNHKQVVSYSASFDWVALIVWIMSLIFSLAPVIVYAGQYLKENNKLDLDFCYQSLFENDIMWVFSTVLLFCIVNQLVLFFSGKQKNLPMKPYTLPLVLFGILICILTELFWITIKLLSFDDKPIWALVIGGILVAVSMVIATPLQINFIKEGE